MIYKDGYFYEVGRGAPVGEGWEALGVLRVEGNVCTMFRRRAPLAERIVIRAIDALGEWLAPPGPTKTSCRNGPG